MPPIIGLTFALIHIYSICRKHTQDGLLGEVPKALTDQEVCLLNAQVYSGLPQGNLYLLVLGVQLLKGWQREMLYSSTYKRIKKRNSYTVVFQDSGCAAYGQILFFVSASNNVFAFVSKFEVLRATCQSHFGLSHDSLDKLSASRIVPIESNSGELVCIPASQLQAKCIFVCCK